MTHPNLKLSLAAAASAAVIAPLSLHADGYGNAVLVDSPLAFYRLGDSLESASAINRIAGSPIGDGSHISVTHGVPGIPIEKANPATNYSGRSRTIIPHTPDLNPPPGQSFTIEAWLRPTEEGSLTAGQAPLYNRKTEGNRQGWVFFQRGSIADTTNPDGQGFNFRMYNENSGSSSINLYGGSYVIGQWVHLAATWDAAASRATLYVDGISVMDQVVASNPFVANASEDFSIGAYANGSNPFTGDIDEVAFYPVALSADRIFEHALVPYDPPPQQDYAAMIAADGATLYLRQDEQDPNRPIAANLGTLGAEAQGQHFPGAIHSVEGALAGSDDTAMGYRMIDKISTDGGYPTILPNIPELNTHSFSVEAWVKTLATGNSNAQCLIANHDPVSPDRTGWVIWQRSPAQGWNLRNYTGTGNNATINLTSAPYTIGQWQHLVFTFDGTTQTAIIYSNGVVAGTQIANLGNYFPNPGTVIPGIGGFANASENPFEGSIDELAFYDKVLLPDRVLAHYNNGSDENRTTPYEEVVLADAPVAYYRMNEEAGAQVPNLGSAGASATGTYVNAPGAIAGPRPPEHPGFDETSSASMFRGNFTYVELNNPPELNISGPITLEAWIQPAAFQKNLANGIISHGGNDSFASELFLRVENGKYEIGTGTGKASVDIPAEDIGTTGWIHLAGTWNAGTWTLYRNGVAIGTGADAAGPTAIANANWAIGARGRWKYGRTFPAAVNPAEHRVFHGGIATAAIYGAALSAERLLAHYEAGPDATPLLSIHHDDGNVTLIWSGGTLEESPNLEDWTPLPSATSPLTVPADGKRFYRLRY